ncbi:MAG: prephenate dehydratase [Betaproteobacteria bacterium AqS2]|uniref:Bifunctional chorismate mutase/prephenate dehydratase n=1 Tax=Candidatus Amphirhobacter heronislandensis TaxID=1732024 RepID=A0A930UCN4_9GAMM|nr:prephenate dehydratase [Betaproteobacteria bacterium AqS2]
MDSKELAALRAQVDGIDDKIIELLRERMRVAGQIGDRKIAMLKEAQDFDFVDPAREAQVIKRLQDQAGTELPAEFVSRLYREIMAEALNRQHPVKASYLGPAGTFSHEAALQHFGVATELVPQDSIRACADAVEHDKARYAVVPYENSTEGGVGETLALLLETRLRACGETQLRVRQHLLGRAGQDLGALRLVYSHPQSFAQCRSWFEGNLPGAARIECASNSAAALAASKEEGAAAIGPRGAALQHGLEVLVEDIEDNPDNVTRFLILGKDEARPSGNDKTSIVFSVHDRPGALHDMLRYFSDSGLNLTRLESRPEPGSRLGNYMFFVDVIGHGAEEPLKGILAKVAKEAASFTNIGSYPRVEIGG